MSRPHCTRLSAILDAAYAFAGALASATQVGRRRGGLVWRLCDRVMRCAENGLDRN